MFMKKSLVTFSLSLSLPLLLSLLSSPTRTQIAALQNLSNENLSRNDGSYRRVVIVIHYVQKLKIKDFEKNN